MRKDAPVNAPLQASKYGSEVTGAEWREWFSLLNDFYRDILQYMDPKSPLFGTEPASPLAGQLAYADGVAWDPGAGAGYYRYDGGLGIWISVG